MAGRGGGRLRTVTVTRIRGNRLCASYDSPGSREAVECGLEPDTLGFKSTSFNLDGASSLASLSLFPQLENGININSI